jgi:hypothetical protein
LEKQIIVIVLAIMSILVLTFPVEAQNSDSGTITITMTTKSILEIELNPTHWEIGAVEPNKEYKTNPEKTWCTIINRGNCIVDTYINGDDAKWVENPNKKWILSSDEINSEDECVLWYWIAWSSTDYIPVTKSDSSMGSEFCIDLDIGEENQRQFGLKLLTPTSLLGSRDMESTITISAVAA